MSITTEHLKKNCCCSCNSENIELGTYTLSNKNGMSVTLINFGATIARIEVQDRKGNKADVLLGHEDLLNHVGGRFYLGATVGRCTNRIANGTFSIDGVEYNVTRNKGQNMLHGGQVGFDKKYWDAKVLENSDEPMIEFTLTSPDGDEGFPGKLETKIIYTLASHNELKIDYTATTDKPTIVNFTNHAYFNLTGSTDNTILDHVVTINADKYTPTAEESIPTGEIAEVTGTPMDFRTPFCVGERINDNFAQLVNAKGYDHNYVLNKKGADGLSQAATVYDPSSGRFMEVFTNQPGMQFYSGNYLDGVVQGKGGRYLKHRSGLCLECQGFPNAPNIKNFPSVVLRPGEVYKQVTIYKFSVKG